MTLRQLTIRIALVVLIAVLVGGIAYVLSAAQSKQYDASAQLRFGPAANELQILGVAGPNEDQNVAIASDVLDVGSFDIARRTAGALHDPRYNPATVASKIAVTRERGSDVVTIRARAGSSQEAAALADTYVKQYIAAGRQRTTARARDARRALQQALTAIPRRVQRGVGGARGDTLRAQIGLLSVFERTGNPPDIIQGVRAGSNAVVPQTQRNVLFGLLFGAVLGIGLLAARGAISPDRRDDTST